MNHNPRIELTDKGMDIVMKMSEGNPGALTVLMKCQEQASIIDPDDLLSKMIPFGTALSLDTHGIYGSEIWQLYKDVCGQDLVIMLGLLRAVQLGFMPEEELLSAIRGKPLSEDTVAGYIAKVKEFLPDFDRKAETA